MLESITTLEHLVWGVFFASRQCLIVVQGATIVIAERLCDKSTCFLICDLLKSPLDSLNVEYDYCHKDEKHQHDASHIFMKEVIHFCSRCSIKPCAR